MLSDYPEFKPTGDYMLETPFFNMEKFKKAKSFDVVLFSELQEEELGLAAVFGAMFVVAFIVGAIAGTVRRA